MDQDDHVCLCYRVSLRKIRTYLERENPPVASLISECLDAGTGCGWCVPVLEHLHELNQAGKPVELSVSVEKYAQNRTAYKKTGKRPDEG